MKVILVLFRLFCVYLRKQWFSPLITDVTGHSYSRDRTNKRCYWRSVDRCRGSTSKTYQDSRVSYVGLLLSENETINLSVESRVSVRPEEIQQLNVGRNLKNMTRFLSTEPKSVCLHSLTYCTEPYCFLTHTEPRFAVKPEK